MLNIPARKLLKTACLFWLGLALLSIAAFNVTLAQQPPRLGVLTRDPAYSRFDTQLGAMLRTWNSGQTGAMPAAAAAVQLRDQAALNRAVADNQGVEAWIEFDRAGVDEAALRAAGIQADDHYRVVDDYVQAFVPWNRLDQVSKLRGVRSVSLPPRAEPDALISEGVGRTIASRYTNAGFTGQGVKVAVLDLGFTGYSALLGSELPANVIVKSFYGSVSGNGDINGAGQVHGTACAEVVYDMAPNATLYLVNVSSVAEMDAAVHYLVAQGVNIITHSVGWFNASFYDGTGLVSAIVDYATSNGVLWFNSSGNSAQSHWKGGFVDVNLDTYNEFVGNDQTLGINLVAGETVTVLLTWNDWPASTNDYDIGFLNPSNLLVAASVNNQMTGAFPPVERFVYQAPIAGTYSIILQKLQASNPGVQFHLFVLADGPDVLEYPVAESSLSDPAASPNSMTVGAVYYPSNAIEIFSSQGPTSTGLRKPDISGPDGVSSYTYPAFLGTSAATPHAAGAAALIWSQNLTRNAATVRSLLETNAMDLGVPGPDNVFGAGMVTLPAGVTSVNLTSNVSPPQPPNSTITFTAAPSGGTAPYQYKWWLFDGQTWTLLADWSASNTYLWTPTVANANYRIGVWVRSAGNPADAAEASETIPFPIAILPTITGINPATGNSGAVVNATISGTNLTGATAVAFSGTGVTATIGTGGTASTLPVTINISASASGTRTVTVTTPVGTSAPFTGFTVTNSTTPVVNAINPTSGTRGTSIGATISGNNLTGATAVTFTGSGVSATIGAGGTATSLPITIAIDAAATTGIRTFTVTTPAGTSAPFGGFTVNGGALSNVTLTTSVQPPQLPGTTIILAATPTGGTAPHEYKWWQFDGQTWTVLADWSGNDTFQWTPTVANPNYRIGVWVRSAGNSADAAEASATLGFAILAPPPVITGINPTGGIQGASVPATISGTGLNGAIAVTFSGSGVTATIGTGGTATTLPITINIAAGAAPGSRTFTVRTAAATSAAFNGFSVNAPQLVTSVTLTSDVAAPQTPGTTINFTATPNGGIAPQEYKWWQFDGQTWTVLADWSTNNTFAWTPTTPNPNYRVGVWVRSSGSSANAAEAAQTVGFAILAPAPVVTGINPTGGIQGTSVPATISGTGLNGAIAVTFSGSGVAATIGTGGTATTLPITINIAAGAAPGSRTFTVRTAAGTSAAFNGFSVNAPQLVTSVTLISDVPAPQTPGTTINFTATPNGGIAPQEYKWWQFDGQTWTVLADWSTNNTFAWTPTTPNPNYRVGVWVRSAGSSANAAEAAQTVGFAILAPSPAITAIGTTSGSQGTTVTTTISGTNLAGATAVVFGGTGVTATINPGGTATSLPIVITINAGAPVGTRTFTVATPAGMSAPFTGFTVTAPQLVTNVSLATDVPSPQLLGTTVNVTATASGGVAPLQYKWWQFDGQTWIVLADWSTNSAFAWAPATANSNYRVGVWVRSAGNSADSPEAAQTIPYSITPSGMPLSDVVLTADRSAPQPAGTTINLTATAIGGIGPHQFKWWQFDGTLWTVLADWSTTNTLAWTPNTANAAYRAGVWVRNAGNSVDAPQVATTIAFPISPMSVTLTANAVAPQLTGTPIVFTATPSGGVAPQQYKWWQFDGITWTVLADWSTQNSYTWQVNVANPNYRVGVWVRSAGNSANLPEASATLPFAIGP